MNAAQALAGRRRLSQAELDMIVMAHEKFVTGKQGGKRASLKFMNLSGLDLSFRNLVDADFSGYSNWTAATLPLVQRDPLFGESKIGRAHV